MERRKLEKITPEFFTGNDDLTAACNTKELEDFIKSQTNLRYVVRYDMNESNAYSHPEHQDTIEKAFDWNAIDLGGTVIPPHSSKVDMSEMKIGDHVIGYRVDQITVQIPNSYILFDRRLVKLASYLDSDPTSFTADKLQRIIFECKVLLDENHRFGPGNTVRIKSTGELAEVLSFTNGKYLITTESLPEPWISSESELEDAEM